MQRETRTGILRGLLWALSGVAALTGTLVALFGRRAIVGSTVKPDASTDSVLRFYGVVWATQSAAYADAAMREELDNAEVRRIGWLTAVGGAARALAWWRTGAPHPLFRFLTAQELAMPLIVRVLAVEDPPRRRARGGSRRKRAARTGQRGRR